MCDSYEVGGEHGGTALCQVAYPLSNLINYRCHRNQQKTYVGLAN